MRTVDIQLYPNSEYLISAEIEISRELTAKEIEDARCTLETAYGVIEPNEPSPSFSAFHKRLSLIDSELAERLVSLTG